LNGVNLNKDDVLVVNDFKDNNEKWRFGKDLNCDNVLVLCGFEGHLDEISIYESILSE